jgi:hypothetical protein
LHCAACASWNFSPSPVAEFYDFGYDDNQGDYGYDYGYDDYDYGYGGGYGASRGRGRGGPPPPPVGELLFQLFCMCHAGNAYKTSLVAS